MCIESNSEQSRLCSAMYCDHPPTFSLPIESPNTEGPTPSPAPNFQFPSLETTTLERFTN
ncbi:hypothetical protein GQ53DRAFT_463877 [Thozetella sp. PMI_491]|nr:hypothetical protein GQ53DRAFT_463877 [Thozetella sp. PMI_491]